MGQTVIFLLNAASLYYTGERGNWKLSKTTGLFLIIEPCIFSLAIHLPLPSLPGALGHPTPQASSEKETGTMVPSGPYPSSGDTTGASLTNCPCLAGWKSGDCGNCIFPSNCICHMWGLLLWRQVWGPSQWCVKPNSWTLTCTTSRGCARRGLQRGQ